jgi:hypothetical protein
MNKIPQYELMISYRVHFARIHKVERGGQYWLGEEARMSAHSPDEADAEFKEWVKAHRSDESIANPKLLEIRGVNCFVIAEAPTAEVRYHLKYKFVQLDGNGNKSWEMECANPVPAKSDEEAVEDMKKWKEVHMLESRYHRIEEVRLVREKVEAQVI